jgi:hypothetical protein
MLGTIPTYLGIFLQLFCIWHHADFSDLFPFNEYISTIWIFASGIENVNISEEDAGFRVSSKNIVLWLEIFVEVDIVDDFGISW